MNAEDRSYYVANDNGEIACHDCDRGTAEACLEAMKESHPDEGWELMNTETDDGGAPEYRIYLIPNGSLMRFLKNKVTDCACKVWGIFSSEAELRVNFRELAEENFCRDGGEWDRIWAEQMDFDSVVDDKDEERRRNEAYEVAQEALNAYITDRLESMSIEWHNDLKWVRAAKCDSCGNIIEIL